MEIIETGIRVDETFWGAASADVAGQQELFVELCTEAGKDVAGFLLRADRGENTRPRLRAAAGVLRLR